MKKILLMPVFLKSPLYSAENAARRGRALPPRHTYGSQRSVRGETYLIFEDGRVVGWKRR